MYRYKRIHAAMRLYEYAAQTSRVLHKLGKLRQRDPYRTSAVNMTASYGPFRRMPGGIVGHYAPESTVNEVLELIPRFK